MRRVTRENSCEKLINKQVVRWVGSRQIDMRATKHTWTRVCGVERTRDRALTQWQKMERECLNPDTNRNSRHECRDPNTTLHTKQCTQTRERAAWAHSKPRAHMKTRTWWEYQGSVTKPWITLDRIDRTLTIYIYIYIYLLGFWPWDWTNLYNSTAVILGESLVTQLFDNDRLEFWDIFEWKIKRINSADLAAFAHIYQGCQY